MSLSAVYEISFFDHERSNKPTRLRFTWEELKDLFGTFAERTEKLGGMMWSPATYPPGATRSIDNAESASLAVLDFDYLNEAKQRFVFHRVNELGLRAIIHSTFKHGAVDPMKNNGEPIGAFRLIFPLDRKIRPEEWPDVWHELASLFEGCVDGACKDISRVYFLPQRDITRNAEPLYGVQEGEVYRVQAGGRSTALANQIQREMKTHNVPTAFDLSDTIKHGEQHMTLYKEACRLRRFGLLEDAIFAQLCVINETRCERPGTTDAMRQIAKDACKHDPSAPYDIDESGDCEFLLDRYIGRYRYLIEEGSWISWDKVRGVWVREPAVESEAKTLLKKYWGDRLRLAREEAKQGKEFAAETAKKILLHYARIVKIAGVQAALLQLSTEPQMRVSIVDFDANPWRLHTPTQVIDIFKQEVSNATPTAKNFIATACDYVPGAWRGSEWEKFVLQICCGNQELAHYLQKVFGYSATGSIDEHALFFAYGFGSNGKSTLIESVAHVLGDYATVGAQNLLLAKQQVSSVDSYEMASLQGCRLVRVSELDEGKAWEESTVKALTGGDKVKARHPYGKPFSYNPTHKLFVSGNHKPRVREANEGIWRRMRLIPFNADFSAHPDRGLKERLLSNPQAILSWVVEGAAFWRAEGLKSPAVVVEATAEYRRESDDVGRFLAERWMQTADESQRVSRKDMFGDYRLFCEQEGIRFAGDPRWFAGRVREKKIFGEGFMHGGIMAWTRCVKRGEK